MSTAVSFQPFVARAPATSANLGPGFDCLGLALDLWNEVSVRPARETSVEAEGFEAPPLEQNLVLRAAERLAHESGRSLPPMALAMRNRVPLSRGLGSSASAIALGLLIGNQVLGMPPGEPDLLALAVRVEGHPDNVVPSMLGGVRVSAVDEEGRVVQSPVPVNVPLAAALFVPDVRLSTAVARAALPPTLPYKDALFNVSRASLLVAALGCGSPELLREAMRDRLHQPYRAPLFPAGMKLMKAALRAGAYGACISGAGPTVLALCGSIADAAAVAAAMAADAAADGVPGQPRALSISSRGAHIDAGP